MNRYRHSSSGRGKRRVLNIISGILALLVILFASVIFIILSPYNHPRDIACKYTHINIFCRIITVQTVTINGDNLTIGLSDGFSAFDVRGPNGTYKQQAVQDMNNGNFTAAINSWNQSISITTDDAESMVYREDAEIASSQRPYVTIVVATTLGQTLPGNGSPGDQSTSLEVGEDDLRGIYLAQRDFDQTHPNLKVRIVIANLGVKVQTDLNQTENIVLQQIVRLADTDSTFIGVVGFPFSNTAAQAVQVLSAAHIPIISPSASSTSLTNLSYFYRVIPSDAAQGKDAAQFASQSLGVRHVAVFSDNTSPYSKSLAESFTSSFTALGSDYVVIPESFQLSNSDSLDSPLENMLSQNPPVDMIYLAGYSDDLNSLRLKLKADNFSPPIMGGDAFYEFGGYTQGDYSDFYFTAFTYPDIWNALCQNNANCSSPAPDVTDANQYRKTFDPNGVHKNNYGYDRPGPHVWQSYDAISALLQAVKTIENYGQSPSLGSVTNALQNVSFQGTTGHISFSGSDPDNKTVVMLCIDSNHYTQLIGTYGQFAPHVNNLVLDITYIRSVKCA